MNNFLRAIIAGIGARQFGGGCLGTIIVFILIWVALGQCSNTPKTLKDHRQSFETKKRMTVLTDQNTTTPYLVVLKNVLPAKAA